MKLIYITLTAIVGITAVGCRKKGCTDPNAENYSEKAKKDDGSCFYAQAPYTVPSTYAFTDGSGNSTVSYSGQTERLNQLREMVLKMKTGTTATINSQDLKDMFANTGGNGSGNFTFTSTKQLKDKCFTIDQTMFETWMDNIATASNSYSQTASSGQAGTLTSGTSTYLFDANGIEYLQLIEKGLMGAVFMNQALNVYFSDAKMEVDNSTAVDPSNGLYYTTMQHHWDEAFGYFGVSTDFPTTLATDFWGKYCNSMDATLNSNQDMMNNFLKGRAAIGASIYTDRDDAISALRTEWEAISAYQSMKYLDDAASYFGTDNAKFLHALSEAYAFAWNLRYAPLETRKMTQTEHTDLMTMFEANFWNMTVADLNAIKSAIDNKY